MNIIQIYKLFPTQESCVKHLERIRWNGNKFCPYCKSYNNYPLTHNGQYRHHCNSCRKTFSVTVNTIMHDTRLPLQKWFLAISLMANAKKGLSSRQLGRDLELPVKTAHSVCQRIRKAMLGEKSPLLQGIIEADETYVGGKPRKSKKHKDSTPNKRGRGTKKTPIVGVIERGGRVVAEPSSGQQLNHYGLSHFIKEHINTKESILITDEYKGYSRMNEIVPHETINHSYEYERNGIHTNTMEGFWALVKRAWYGQHHHYSKRYTHLYIGEACFKYNHRKKDQQQIFLSILGGMLLV